MVTGNLNTNHTYKHALINQIKLEQCTLSIRVLPDGLSLFIYQGEEEKMWLAIGISSFINGSIIDSLHELWQSESILNKAFKRCSVHVQTDSSIWIPELLFDKDNLAPVVSKMIDYEFKHQELLYDFHFKWDAYQVYTIAKNVKEFLDKNVKTSIQYFNDLYFEFNRSKEQLTIQKKVYYSQSGSVIDIWMMEGTRLTFHKSIRETENDNEIEFKVLSLLQTFKYDFVDDIFYVFDDIDQDRYTLFYTFIKTIKRIDSSSIIKFSKKELKTLPISMEIKRVLE